MAFLNQLDAITEFRSTKTVSVQQLWTARPHRNFQPWRFCRRLRGRRLGRARTLFARVLSLPSALWPSVLGIAIPLLAALLTFVPHMGELLHGGVPRPAMALSALTLLNFFTGPLAREFGWHGYLLGRLCRRWPPALAGLVIGPIWALWHLPVFHGSVFARWTSALGFLLWSTSWAVVFALLVARGDLCCRRF